MSRIMAVCDGSCNQTAALMMAVSGRSCVLMQEMFCVSPHLTQGGLHSCKRLSVPYAAPSWHLTLNVNECT